MPLSDLFFLIEVTDETGKITHRTPEKCYSIVLFIVISLDDHTNCSGYLTLENLRFIIVNFASSSSFCHAKDALTANLWSFRETNVYVLGSGS